MDTLVPMPVVEWPKLRDAFRSYSPVGISGYNLLDTQIKFRALGLDCTFQVYCPYGDIANGMVAKMQKVNKLHELIIIANSEDTSKLEEALLHTETIGWTTGITEVPYVAPGSTRRLLDQLYPRLGLQLVMDGPGCMHVLSRNSKPYEDVVCPEGTYAAPVKPEHIPLVDSVWPHRYPTSDWFFSLLIQAGQSWGLYTTDNSLVAWMFINEAGFLCHLYCDDRHRRKGYAEFLVKLVSNEQISQGRDAFCYIVEGNSNSMALFSKMGYENIGWVSWMSFSRS